ncbi:adenine deaminase C-terminal domain-containing protein [Martelella sp. FLE1502]
MHVYRFRSQSIKTPAALRFIDESLFAVPSGRPLSVIDFSGPRAIRRDALALSGAPAALPEGLTLMARIADDRTLVELCGASGLGRWRGALAIAHENGGMTVFGRSGQDMAVAANAVIKAGGGLAVAEGDWINALIRLPARGQRADPVETEREIASVGNALAVLVDRKPSFLLKKLLDGTLAPPAKGGPAAGFGADGDDPLAAAE